MTVEEKQTLPVTLTRTEGLDQRIVVSNATGRLHIYDDYKDGKISLTLLLPMVYFLSFMKSFNFLLFLAVSFIGFEADTYTTSEEEGVAEVCVKVFFPAVETPIGFPFYLRLESSSGSAGGFIRNL